MDFPKTLQASSRDLIAALQSAIGILNLAPNDALRCSVRSACERLLSPAFRIAVFGPFNYGKSTLLNAMLGEKALPIDLVPTTGTAILVKYGETVHTTITLTSGQQIEEAGTAILQQYAILDEQRCMQKNVIAVEVTCPHPFLQAGIELLDLPGTDDRDAQDNLVQHQLLTADLIIQVLDGRKLMTLQERETLRDWLLDREIRTVVMLVNFLNLLDSDEQQQVYRRLMFVAESFRADLPPGISNLYRVDALPALRARLKGDVAAVQVAGLPAFESALQTIVQAQQEQGVERRVARLRVIAQDVQKALQKRLEKCDATVNIEEQARTERKRQIQQQAQDLLQKGFSKSTAAVRQWLSLQNLLSQYQTAATLALQHGQFDRWETQQFRPAWQQQQQTVTEWVYKACDFFDVPHPPDLSVCFPPPPFMDVPSSGAASQSSSASAQSSGSGNANSLTSVAIASAVGGLLGGPIGAALLGGTSYLLSRSEGEVSTDSFSSYEQTNELSDPSSDFSEGSFPTSAVEETCVDRVMDYLEYFSKRGLESLEAYEQTALKIINIPLQELSSSPEELQEIESLRSGLATLTQALNAGSEGVTHR